MVKQWLNILPPETARLGQTLYEKAKQERATGHIIYPDNDHIFRALDMTPPDKVKVVIVGQDPYHGPGQANGLAFSVNPGVALPPSLRNIFKELVADIGCPMPTSGDLTPWAKQGVLLLNTVLTVEEGKANSHAKWGWKDFTWDVFNACTSLEQPIVFILWGKQAQAFVAGLDLPHLRYYDKAYIISSHPSPLGATKGNEAVPAFIDSRPFSMANQLLEQMGGEPVDWVLP